MKDGILLAGVTALALMLGACDDAGDEDAGDLDTAPEVAPTEPAPDQPAP